MGGLILPSRFSQQPQQQPPLLDGFIGFLPSGSMFSSAGSANTIAYAGNASANYSEGRGVAFSGGGATVTLWEPWNLDVGVTALVVFSPNAAGVKGTLLSIPYTGGTIQFATNTSNGLQVDRQQATNLFSTASLGIAARGVYCAAISYIAGGTLTAAFEGRIVSTVTPSSMTGNVNAPLIARRSSDFTEAFAGGILGVVLFKSKLPDHQMAKYTANPWQVFEAPARRLWPTVVGGPQSLIVTPSGGLAFSGASAVIRSTARQPVGGLTLAGAATVRRGVARAASGGLALAGAAAVVRGAARAPAGGIVMSGTAPFSSSSSNQSLTVTPAGGIAFAGAAPTVRQMRYTPTGGIVFGGAAGYSNSAPLPAFALYLSRRRILRRNFIK